MRAKGFTIVELLIVIVVIAILAAITIVGYQEIQKRARQASILSSLDFYEKTLRMYKHTYGHYPVGSGGGNYCLGDGYVQSSAMAQDVCWQIDRTPPPPIVTGQVNATLNQQLAEFSPSKPRIDPHEILLGQNGTRIRGIIYYVANWNGDTSNQQVRLYYALDGTNDCGRGEPGTISSNGFSFSLCTIDISQFVIP